MSSFRQSAFVPFSSEQMYFLVNHIELYPEFLPWCSSAIVIESTDSQMDAELTISKGPFTYNFSTTNFLVPNKSIELKLLKGPFKYFRGHWAFNNDGSRGCVVELSIDYEASTPFLRMALSVASGAIVNSLVQAFVSRAHEKY
jgi:ribosome-associated toxin RatA of RatAB toxin-antitoxin module